MSARPRARLLLAFAAVYVIWGSTYLAIRWAIETLPGFLMAGVRFLIAGGILYAAARLTGTPRPTRRNWRNAAVVGGLLLVGGNGGVVWSEQFVASGLAALLVATEPLWVVLLDWLRPGGTRPTGGEIAGLLLGFGGVALLIGPSQSSDAPHIAPLGAVVLILATLSWAAGSIYSRHAELPRSPLLSTGMNMLAGGAMLMLLGSAVGQWSEVRLGAVSTRSAVSLLYLIVFGAIVGFTAYLWILKQVPIATAATYAYVNPIVAVLLGWGLAGEAINARVIAAAAVIVGSVVIITLARAPRTVLTLARNRALGAAGDMLRRMARKRRIGRRAA